MIRIPGNYINGEAELRIAPRIQALKTESDAILEARIKEGIKFADRQDSRRVPFGIWEVVTAPSAFYDGIAAMRLLSKRHGEDYVLRLVGYRKP